MLHISRSTYSGLKDRNGWRMPETLHRTYCGDTDISGYEIDNANPTCEHCMDSKVWEDIDNMNGGASGNRDQAQS